MSLTSGSDVLLLHGQPGGARDWDRVITALGTRARAVAIDRPGWDGRTEPRDLAGNADAALAALDEASIERAVVVGHSFGGAIAAWLAASQPERVRALVLAAPSANLASLEPIDRWLTLPVVGPLTSTAWLTGLGLALSTRRVRRRIATTARLDEAYLRASGRALRTRWARRAFDAEQRALLADLPTLERRLASIAAPTWIVMGARDWIVPSAGPERLAEQLPSAQLEVLPGAGHLLPQLHHRRLADAILAALNGSARG